MNYFRGLWKPVAVFVAITHAVFIKIMELNNKSYERLAEIIKWSGLSTHAFAMKIGLKRSENIYRVIRTQENVSPRLAVKIVETYPQLNRDWLLYDEGEMMIDIKKKCNELLKIPFFEKLNSEPLFTLNIPMFKDADFAINLTDRAMEPIIPNGSTIVLKEQTINKVIYGKIYYIETDAWSMIRVIRKSNSSDDEFVLEVVNTTSYDNMVIRKDEIRNLYLVCGIVNVFS